MDHSFSIFRLVMGTKRWHAVVAYSVFICTILLSLQGCGKENADRAVIAMRRADGSVYMGWRSFGRDPQDAGFHVYRITGDEQERLTGEPIRGSSNYVDREAPGGSDFLYRIEMVRGNNVLEKTSEIRILQEPCLRIPLTSSERFQKAGVGDLDGDGRLDYVIKQPDFNVDPYQRPGYWKRSRDTYKIEAYGHDGNFLWRHDMGWSIEEGIWYSPYVVYDLDGDGRAEVYCKGGEGDPRTPEGHVVSGVEWLFKLDGRTGRIIKRIPWIEQLPEIGEYNYQNRNMLAIAYLDGIRPYLIMQRGTYRAIVIDALDKDLKRIWRWNSHDEKEKYDRQGAHTLHPADIDGDGKDELVVGSCTVDHDGKAIWTLGTGHPDVCYVGDIDPDRPGLEIFLGIEPRQPQGAVRLVEAATGQTIWANSEPTVHVHSQGMAADILAEHIGQECYAGESKGGDQYWLFTAKGELLNRENMGSLVPRPVWWDSDPQKEIVIGTKLFKFKSDTLLTLEPGGRCAFIGDILGDWREEIIMGYPGELWVYSTTILSDRRQPWLLEDRLYRLYVAVNTMGYNTPPQHSGF